MDITSAITITLKSESNKSFGTLNRFKPGEILRLKVVELNGDRALIDFGKFRATADIKVPVRLGENLYVKVLESDKQLKMSLVGPGFENSLSKNHHSTEINRVKNDDLKHIQAELKQISQQIVQTQSDNNKFSPFINVLNRLSSYFQSFDLKENVAQLIPQLAAYIENSGVLFEKRIENLIAASPQNDETLSLKELIDLPDLKQITDHDLKANLLRMRQFVENKEISQQLIAPKVVRLLSGLIEPLLNEITDQQGRAIHQLESSEPLQIFTFVLPLRGDEQAARLKVYYHKKRPEDAKDGYRISLLLSMDQLGDVRADLFLLDNELNITFYVKANPTKKEIERHYDSLKDVLNNFFDSIRVTVVVSAKKVLDFDREDIAFATNRRVDLRV